MRTSLPTYASFIVLTGLLSACAQPLPASTTEQPDSTSKTAITFQPPKILRQSTKEEKEKSKEQFFVCVGKAALDFDDGVSDARTIATVVGNICDYQFLSMILSNIFAGKKESEYNHFVRSEGSKFRTEMALQMVLSVRSTLKQRANAIKQK